MPAARGTDAEQEACCPLAGAVVVLQESGPICQ
jgi:hypothetical protein